MHDNSRHRISILTQADHISHVETIQPLWNNYGTLSRVHLQGGKYPSVIVKHIQIPHEHEHPRGFGGTISRQRKIKSYRVELHWYQNFNRALSESTPTPACLDAFEHCGELFLVLEDLCTRGFTEVLQGANPSEMGIVLRWLAQFHAQHLHVVPTQLWPCGTYWHLATRPEELARIRGTRLHMLATLLDARLRCGEYQTFVHGDAKIANFLFSEDRQRVAAVDFQYVGAGCGMKDVAYFLGSCLSGIECERMESHLLSVYFDALKTCLPAHLDADALEREWRELYPIAWADFQRFMTGWSPNHRKLTRHSDAITTRALEQITDDLLVAARQAAINAGDFIHANRHRTLEVSSKGFRSLASDVVTEIDVTAQSMILQALQSSIERYDLGVLAEEGHHDDSRLEKHAFWTIDPLDGTQCFVDTKSGYATSIALVSQAGTPILGVVYDPIHRKLYETVIGRGVRMNGAPIDNPAGDSDHRTQWFADSSLQNHPNFAQLADAFQIKFVGGAVINILHVLTSKNAIYIKMPKQERGGCAIWDLAAVAQMLVEEGGQVQCYDGSPLNFNRPESVYFNDVGLVFASADVHLDTVLSTISSLA